MQEDTWGFNVTSEKEGLDTIASSYGTDADVDYEYGQRFTIGGDGTIYALVAGDMGYEATHIAIPRDHILAMVEDWPEFSKTN